MKKRPEYVPMIFKKHEPRSKGITVFDKQGNRMTRHGSKDMHSPMRNQPLPYIKGDTQ